MVEGPITETVTTAKSLATSPGIAPRTTSLVVVVVEDHQEVENATIVVAWTTLLEIVPLGNRGNRDP